MAGAKGYDVSDYQSGIPADAGFVFIKATEGARTGQRNWRSKQADARRRGLVVGYYHFFHAENAVADEVSHFCSTVGDVPVSELLVLDFEPYNQPVTAAVATAKKNQWLAAVKQRYPRHKVGVYTNRDWWFKTDDNAGDFLWIADYQAGPGAPRVQAQWAFHQYTDAPLDTNVYRGSLEELRAWVGGVAVPPPPAAPSWVSPPRVTRAQLGWPATASSLVSQRQLGVKVHYLGTGYDFGPHADCAAYVNGLRQSHLNHPTENYSDIAYNELVCEHGVRFEGRGYNRRTGANGNAALNSTHYAVCALLGSSGSTQPTEAQLHGLRDAIEAYRQYGSAGSEIRGHKDGFPTSCPGGPLYAWVQAGAPRPSGGPVGPVPRRKAEVSVVEKDLKSGWDPVETLFNCVGVPASLSVGCDLGDIRVAVFVLTNSSDDWYLLADVEVFRKKNLAFWSDTTNPALPADTRKIAVKRWKRHDDDDALAVPAVVTLKYKPEVI